MGLFNLFKKKKNGIVKGGKRAPLIKRPPDLLSAEGKRERVKNHSSVVDDRETFVEYDEDGYDYALDENGMFDFDRDGSGVGDDDDDDDIAGFDDDDDDDDDD